MGKLGDVVASSLPVDPLPAMRMATGNARQGKTFLDAMLCLLLSIVG